MIQFDEHIFQRGWNHQLVRITPIYTHLGLLEGEQPDFLGDEN